MKEVVIASAVRTPLGRFQGSLSSFSAPALGSIVIAEAVKRAGIKPESVQEVVMGDVVTAGLGQNPARQAARGAKIPDAVGAYTINKVCGSGLKSVMLAANSIIAGEYECVVAGGMESMTNAPYLLPNARAGQRLGHGKLIDAMVIDGLWDIYNDFHMGSTAELVSGKYSVTRQMQDEFALNSHIKAARAAKEGKFAAEIVPVKLPARPGGQSGGPPAGKSKEEVIFDKDEGIRSDATLEGLAKLKPAFKPDGTVTAGNASQISDGAAALVVMSAEFAAKHNVKPLARINGYATGGLAPEWVMMAPLEAVKRLLDRTGSKITDFDLFEINEAFSAAAVALTKELKIPPEKVNVNGGAVALGHPIGCSGARILTTLIYALKDSAAVEVCRLQPTIPGCNSLPLKQPEYRKLKRGLSVLCLGGGNAVAMSVDVW